MNSKYVFVNAFISLNLGTVFVQIFWLKMFNFEPQKKIDAFMFQFISNVNFLLIYALVSDKCIRSIV